MLTKALICNMPSKLHKLHFNILFTWGSLQGPEFLDKMYSVFTTSAEHTDLQDFLLKPGVVDWQQKGLLIPGMCSATYRARLRVVPERVLKGEGWTAASQSQ